MAHQRSVSQGIDRSQKINRRAKRKPSDILTLGALEYTPENITCAEIQVGDRKEGKFWMVLVMVWLWDGCRKFLMGLDRRL